MLKPLKVGKLVTPNFVVVDIENRPNGDVVTIDICWRESVGMNPTHKLFHSWKTCWNWLAAKARRDKRFRILYAHNGGGWDWLSLAYYLLRDGKRKHQAITGIVAASQLVTMTVRFPGRMTVHFCDSLQLLRSPLSTLAKKFGVTNKIDIGGRLPHELYDSPDPADKELYWAYVAADTESLLEVMEKAITLLNENVAEIGEFGYTIGSTAMKVFRTMLTREIAVPYDEKVKLFLRQGYKGGRVEVFQCGYYPDVSIYDVNSLYPYAMLTTDVPTSDRGLWVSHFHPTLPGCYRVNFRQRNTDIPAILMSEGLGVYSGSGTYYTPELALLKECDPGCEIEIESGYVFLDREKIFQDYVNRLYAVRLADKDGPVSLLAKFLLNSLYGKFAQNPERSKIIEVVDDDTLYEMCEDGADMISINEELRIYTMKTHHAAAFEHVGIAGMITSRAREILYRGILQAGKSNVVYCDTDSVHVANSVSGDDRRLYSLEVSDKIGAFKKEFHGEGVYVGKKLYALRNANDDGTYNTKIRAKGVSVGGRNGSDIRFDDFVRLSRKGERFKAEFYRPATAKQVFNGDTPCTFRKRTRTLRRIIA